MMAVYILLMLTGGAFGILGASIAMIVPTKTPREKAFKRHTVILCFALHLTISVLGTAAWIEHLRAEAWIRYVRNH